MSASKAQRRAAVELATEVAQKIVERKDIDSATLEVVASGLKTARELLEGHRESGDLDAEVAEMMVGAFGDVERGATLWPMQYSVAEKVLARLQPEEVDELVSATRWADDDDVLQSLPALDRDPWEDDEVPMRALSSTETGDSESPRAGMSPDPEKATEPVLEVVEAELLDESPEEVERVTRAQTRYRLPEGSSYAPPRRFGDTLGSRDGRARERAAAQSRFGGDTFIEGD